MASVQDTIECARKGSLPSADVTGGITTDEIGNLLSMRGSRAWHQGFQAGQAVAAEKAREHEAEVRREHERVIRALHAEFTEKAKDTVQRLTYEHLAASAPLADAIQKARKATDAAATAVTKRASNGRVTSQQAEITMKTGDATKALAECADAYAKFTSGLSK
jgi:hypothetical protein